MAGEVVNNESKSQYELSTGSGTALAAYQLDGDTIRLTHTEVPEETEGQGVGTRLVAGALDDVRARGLKVVPLCSFVRHYIDTHPDAQDLVSANS
ncbi:MAG TPA: GNAT family N-acetyltransferase [Allosphingosinicella sp.]|nr:GNAT family N-acetyltransferase [Allosphingosinicella sp.]